MRIWWNNIPLNQKIYWFIAFPFTAMFLIQTIMTFIGAIDDATDDIDTHDMDINDDLDIITNHHDSLAPFRVFTLRNIIVFFTILSWSGIVLSKLDLKGIFIFLLASLIGIIITLCLSAITYFIVNLTESGNLNLNNAVNSIGEVYLTIPPRRKGSGKIMVVIQNSLKELDAITDGDELITGTKVIITSIVDNQYLLVEKYIEL